MAANEIETVGASADPHTGSRRRRLRPIPILMGLFVLQFVAFVSASAAGWGARGVVPAPAMERVGAPVGYIDVYAALLRDSFPLVDDHGRVVATASAAGVPGTWSRLPTAALHVFSQNPLTTLHKLKQAQQSTLLFFVPQHLLPTSPLSVRIAGHDHSLTELDEDVSHDLALMYVTVGDGVAKHVGSPNLLWLVRPRTTADRWPVVLLRRDPRKVSSTAFALSGAASSAGYGDGRVQVALPAVAAGGPIVALVSGQGYIIGFAKGDSNPTHFVGTPSAAHFARLVVGVNVRAPGGLPTLGIEVKTASEAVRAGAHIGAGVGVLVTDVLLHSAADAGLVKDDVITSYDGNAVVFADELIARVRAGDVGTWHQLTVRTPTGDIRTLRVRLALHG